MNGRLASQFAPLVQAAHGRSTYDACSGSRAARIGVGAPPARVPRRELCRPAVRDAFVEAVPPPEPGLECWSRRAPALPAGDERRQSYRLAILYARGSSREHALARAKERADALSFRLQVPARTR